MFTRLQQWLDQYPNRVPELYGTVIALGLIMFFLACWALGVVHVVVLRLFNLPLLFAGVYLALRQFSRTHQGLGYFKGLMIGVSSSFIGVSTFVLFLFLLFEFYPEVFQKVTSDSVLKEYLDPYIATFAVWVEGIFSGFISTFILINFLETSKE